MNRIEHIISELENKVEEHKGNQWIGDVYEKQLSFFQSLLEECETAGKWEIHSERIKPNVFGYGDVSYTVHLQLKKFKTPEQPVILVVSKLRVDET